MTQEAREWQDELADIVTDSLDIDWNANICAGHLLANGVYPPSVVAELVSCLRDCVDVMGPLAKEPNVNPWLVQASALLAKLEASK